MNRSKLSALRKRLTQLVAQRAQCEQVALQPATMVAASFLERTFRPSQPRPYYYLSASVRGRSQQRYVPARQARLWRPRAERWQDFHRALARWVKLNRDIERTLRALGRERCVPLPPAARKGQAR
jgi:hypothetical protein